MQFHVLGPLEAHTASGVPVELGARKSGALLAALLLNANAWVSVDQLIDAIWHEQAVPASAVRNLRSYVWQLRGRLRERLEGRPGAYRITVLAGELDTDRVGALAASARLAMSAGAHAQASEQLADALALWRGTPYAGLTFDAALTAAARLDELRLELRELLAEAYLELARPSDAVALLRRITDEQPLREGSWVRLVLALHRAGRRADALAAYDRARQVMIDELGVDPGPELVAAQRKVLLGAASCRSDLPRDLADFTGRGGELAALVDRPAAVTVIDGMAGSGKTALAVHAAHRLAARFPDGQLYLDLRAHREPGPLRPAAALARLLRAAGVTGTAPSDVDESATLWRSWLAGRRVLLVLDDAAGAAQVEPLLPGAAGCVVLVTTRGRTLGVPGGRSVSLGPLSTVDSQALLATLTGGRSADADPAAVTEVVRRCGGLPAALRQAANRLNSHPLWTFARLAADPRIELPALLGPCCELLTSTERVVLDAISLHGDAEVSDTRIAAACGLETVAAQRILTHLVDQNLLIEPAGGRYRMHRLLREHLLADIRPWPARTRVA